MRRQSTNRDSPRRRPREQNHNRVIGTFTERKAVLEACERVLKAMSQSQRFNPDDLESLQTTIVGFLREHGRDDLLGWCSYSHQHRTARNAGERTWRLLVHRPLVHRSDGQLEATLYHEFLHAVLGYDEDHGPTFQSMEALWPFNSNEVG